MDAWRAHPPMVHAPLKALNDRVNCRWFSKHGNAHPRGSGDLGSLGYCWEMTERHEYFVGEAKDMEDGTGMSRGGERDRVQLMN